MGLNTSAGPHNFHYQRAINDYDLEAFGPNALQSILANR